MVQSCDQRGGKHKIYRIQRQFRLERFFLVLFFDAVSFGGAEGMDQFLALGLVCTELHTHLCQQKRGHQIDSI